MTSPQLASWRRPAPASVRMSASASGFVHAAVVAVALFGYPVLDIVFAPPSGVSRDVMAHGDSDRVGAAGAASALDIEATDNDEQTTGGIDSAHDVPTDSTGEVGYTVVGDTPDPQKRAGRPDMRPIPPIANAAEPTRPGEPDGRPEGTSQQLAAREILVMVTLLPREPDRLDGSKSGKTRIAEADGDGKDTQSREENRIASGPQLSDTGVETPAAAAVPVADTPGTAIPAQTATAALIPDTARGAYATDATTGPARPKAAVSDDQATQPVILAGAAPEGVAIVEPAPMITTTPRAGGTPAPAFDVDRADPRADTGNADDEKAKRFNALVLAVTGTDERFASAIIDPQPAADIGGQPDPTKQQRIRLLQTAASAGYTRAQFALARQYIIGEEPQATMREAIELLRDAAERGDIDAQLLLGVIYAQGKIARRDLVEAQLYFSLAAAQGVPDVDHIIKDVERDMTLEQIIEARRIGREYKKLLYALTQPTNAGTRGDLLRDELLDAAAAGNAAEIARALARGADLEAADSAGRTAVINAAWRGRMDAIELLLGVGAEIDTRDERGRTALTWAASNGHLAIVDRLVAAGADLDAEDAEGTTALMRAAWNGHRDIVSALVEAGASVGRSDSTGRTAIDYASRSGNPGIATALRKVGI